MPLRRVKMFKVWSNVFYLVPVVLGFYYGLIVTVVLTCGVIFFGVLYHLSNEKKWGKTDQKFALMLIASNLVLCYLGRFLAPYFWVALLFVILSFTYHFYLQDKGQYDLNHGMWHLYGALITLFCIFTFAFAR